VNPRLYRRVVIAFGVVAMLLGLLILVETARAGGGQVGYLIGLLFLLLGAGRIYLQRRR
jgi:uncharacterized membrane protein HdeD (DUF308 family)